MQISVMVSFDPQEASTLRVAFLPIARLADYPDVLSALNENGIGDLDRAKAIATNLGTIRENERTHAFDGLYLRKAGHLLAALGQALRNDLALQDSETPAALYAAVVAARHSQLAAITPAVEILRAALGCAGTGYTKAGLRP